MHFFRRYIIAGLLVWLPIIVTFVVIRFIIDLLDNTLALIPASYQPEHLIGFYIPGIGLLLSLLIVFFTGMLARNFFGKEIVRYGEAVVDRIPLVGSVYNAAKQVSVTVFSKKGQAFKKVFLIEFPRTGMWSIAFQTGIVAEEIRNHVGEDMLTMFVPTTPNPTSGFIMMVPRSQATELQMSVDQAFKLIISLGVMQPSLQESTMP